MSWDVTAHHICTAVVIRYTLNIGYGGTYAICMIPFLEWHGPFLSITWIMKHYGTDKQWPRMNLLFKVCVVLTFTVGRQYFVNYILYRAWCDPAADCLLKAMLSFIPVLSMFWQARIIGFVLKALRP